MDRGFQHSLIHGGGGIGQVGDVSNYFEFDRSYFDPILLKDGVSVQTKGYCSDVFTDAAIAFIEQNKTTPFFLYLAFNAPHTPLQVPDKYYQKYRNLVPSSDRYPSKGQPFPDMNEREIETTRKVYAMVTNIDENLGRLLRTLDQLNLSSNTAVVFLTDNGPQQRRYVAGLRGRKSSVFEGGVKVPCFMRFPGRLPENLTIDTPTAHIDLLPTILALCGISAPGGVLIDGQNLLPLVDNKPVDWAERPLFFHWQRGFPEPYHNIAVRKGRYKLVGQFPHGAGKKDFALFDLEKDPYELENVQSSHPEIVAELIAEFDSWYAEMMESPHLRQIQRIKLGTRHENPVILNRNDAKGSEGIWAQDKVYGYWDVEVTKEGLYDFSFHFREKVKQAGVMKLRMGTIQRSLYNENTEASILAIKNVTVTRGHYRLEPWYRAKGENYFPFYVEVKKR
jgi:arylsulfatase